MDENKVSWADLEVRQEQNGIPTDHWRVESVVALLPPMTSLVVRSLYRHSTQRHQHPQSPTSACHHRHSVIQEPTCFQHQIKLEIWGKDQRESAQRPKSDRGKLGGGVKFPRHQSHVAQTQMHWYTPNVHCRLRVGQHKRL